MFDSGDDGDGAKDTPTGTTTGERGVMVAMGHRLCVCFGVCGETTKNMEESKIVNRVFLQRVGAACACPFEGGIWPSKGA